MLACDPFPMEKWAAAGAIRYVSLDDLLAASDVVSLHLPLTPKTHYVLNAKTLALLKPGAYVLITAHQAFLTREALSEIARVTIGNVSLLQAGRPFLPGTPL